MSSFLLINDIHLSDRAPASCTETYLDDLFRLLYEATKMALSKGCDAIILAGDVFDNKVPARTSHGTIMRVIDWVDYTQIPVYAVPGNHDLSHDRLDSLRENQPLGVLLAAGKIEWLHGWLIDEYGSFDDSVQVYGVPWLPTFDDANVSDALREYREELTSPAAPQAFPGRHPRPAVPAGQGTEVRVLPRPGVGQAMRRNRHRPLRPCPRPARHLHRRRGHVLQPRRTDRGAACTSTT